MQQYDFIFTLLLAGIVCVSNFYHFTGHTIKYNSLKKS